MSGLMPALADLLPEAPSFRQKVAIGLRLRRNMVLLRARRRRQLRDRLKDAPASKVPCTICESRRTVGFKCAAPTEIVEKIFCRRCEHLFSGFDQTESGVADPIFKFAEPNTAASTQTALLLETAERRKLNSGTFLDFGVGGNISAFAAASVAAPQHRFMGCDIYPATVDGYFQTHDPGAPLAAFDGISSYAVLEHLTNTREAWQLLNRLLKPVSQGGGIMVHAFPSQLHYDMNAWEMQIRTHTCLFSRRSLRIICDKSGFSLVRADPPRLVGPHGHPILVFRKSRDV